jgi:hypothetical protein
VRRTLLSVVVGLAGAGAVASAAWSLQTVALPPPARADRVVADVAQWLDRYRLAVDIFHLDGRRATGLCLRGSFRLGDIRVGHASVLDFTRGPVVLVYRRHGSDVISGRNEQRLPVKLAAKVGCSYELLVQLGTVAQASHRVRAEHAYAAGQAAIALHLPSLRDERLTLYVSPTTYRPLVAIARVDGREATARLFLTRVTRGLLARFRFGPDGKPEQRP